MFQLRTDLAIEAREIFQSKNREELRGVEVGVEKNKNYEITRVKILNEYGEKKLGKPRGTYITIEVPSLKKADQELKDEISKVLAKELKALIKPSKSMKSLVVGLGNWNVTPDALGPKVIDKVYVTRHLFKAYNKTEDETMSDVSAISPGVMGVTGIETSETIKGIVEKTKPDIIVAVDALASRKMERVSTTIQITDTGISPGSGVGNERKALNEETLGVPVIAIGIPTVVDAATMVNDTMELMVSSLKKQADKETSFYSMLEEMESGDKYEFIKEVLAPYMPNVVVTPKEIDELISNLSLIIANGINISLHHGIDLKDVNKYIN
ncbi:spore protease [Proteiniborus ethanoligenes]|uniref:Germination protease n=1 Tax=Proteiniborus ethanoligenes TaxID=415015 RepID=A0A1H3R3H5_9FIRM|nr:GPR endopeptidase [Proteiniborus ethanoligenes]SDZ19509.1 spore protease [Proteiniborus ethanoligenes]